MYKEATSSNIWDESYGGKLIFRSKYLIFSYNSLFYLNIYFPWQHSESLDVGPFFSAFKKAHKLYFIGGETSVVSFWMYILTYSRR